MAKNVPSGILGSMSASSWAGGKLLEKAAQQFPTGPVTSKEVLEGLYSLNGETAGGILPPIAYKRDQAHVDSNRCILPVRLEKGRFVAPKGDTYVCDPAWKPVTP